jgi:hypothetical protein
MRQLLIVLFLFFVIPTHSQTSIDYDKKSISDSCDRFMKLFQAGQPKESIQILKNISVLGNESLDKLALKIYDQMDIVSSNYGEVNSYQFVKERIVGDFLVKRLYVLKFDRFYLKFAFTLYKNKTGWKLTSFIYNEDIDELFL